jgi:hypothetical protein
MARGWGGVVVAIALLILVFPLAAGAQPVPLGLAIHRVDPSRFPTVQLYLSAADSRGVPITGLDRAAFQVTEDGKPVQGAALAAVTDSQEPIAVALAVDVLFLGGPPT